MKKRDGGALARDEIRFFVAGVTDGTLPDYQASALLMAILLRGMSAEEVWAVLADVSRWHEWTPTITRVETLDARALETGARFRVLQPRLRPAIWTVTESQPAKKFTWESRGPGTLVVAEHVIDPAAGGSSRVLLRVAISGLLGTIFGYLFGSLTSRYLSQEAAALKLRVERAR